MKKIVIINYGVGNIGSVANMIKKLGFEAEYSCDTSMIRSADRIILPGVGSFDYGMESLKKSKLIPLLEERIFNAKIPLLGICLGMQLLLSSSEEGKQAGLSWITGECQRFSFSSLPNKAVLKIPHMGWNVVSPQENSLLFNNASEEMRFYFVHSYHAVAIPDEYIAATCTHGYEFACAIQKDNLFGVQFHPEKSHRFGLTLLKNFIEQ